MRAAAAAGVLLCLAGCGGANGAVSGLSATAPVAEAVGWRRVATPRDRARLRRWREAWTQSLTRARVRSASAVAAQGALFAYDSALGDPVPPPGSYRCRVFKLGAQSAGLPDFTAYPWFACRVAAAADGETLLTKLDGSQRHVGTIHPVEGNRAAFLGTLMLGDETRVFPYGRDASRDVAGWVERVGPSRWRLAMPYPAFESTLDVMELVPAD